MIKGHWQIEDDSPRPMAFSPAVINCRSVAFSRQHSNREPDQTNQSKYDSLYLQRPRMQPRSGLISIPVKSLKVRLGRQHRTQRQSDLKTVKDNRRVIENEQSQQDRRQNESARREQ